MILHNPESVKVTNDYLYNIIHTATLNDHRDIIPIAIEVSKTVTCVFNTVSSQRRYEIINIPCDLRIPICVIVGVSPYSCCAEKWRDPQGFTSSAIVVLIACHIHIGLEQGSQGFTLDNHHRS